jgi:hypothetical protein
MTERHPDFRVVKAPDRSYEDRDWQDHEGPRIFLAGSIDMGRAVNWQTTIENALQDYRVTILNPRRDDFDAKLVQDINNPPFRDQVDWELDAIAASDFILFYFDPKGQAPITLMELGITAERYRQGDGPLPYVCCPQGYWRKGNVDIVCDRYGIKQAPDLNGLIELLRNHLDSWDTDCTKHWD